jgi:hypothetical protein
MKNLKWFVFVLMLAGMCFFACENPIMERWWRDREPEVIIVPSDPGEPAPAPGPSGPPQIIFVPQIVVETIIEEHWDTIFVMVPTIVQQRIVEHIEILEIDFIIFAGDQDQFNGLPFGTAVSALTNDEISRNNLIVRQFGKAIFDQWALVQSTGGVVADNPNLPYFLILHGHANPVIGDANELLDLRNLSTHRASSAQNAITGLDFWTLGRFPSPVPPLLDPYPQVWRSNYILDNPPAVFAQAPYNLTPGNSLLASLSDLISIAGYGGGRTLQSSNPAYASLNRRVEAILFTVRREALDSFEP